MCGRGGCCGGGCVVVRCETRSALESFRSKACCAKESTVGISTLHVAEFGAEHTSEFGAEHTPCVYLCQLQKMEVARKRPL